MTPMNWGSYGSVAAGFTPVFAPRPLLLTYVSFPFGLYRPPTGISSARFLFFHAKALRLQSQGGVRSPRVKLKEIDGMAPQDVERGGLI